MIGCGTEEVEIKIGDFGLSRGFVVSGGIDMTADQGTPIYGAPEVYEP